MNLFAKTDLGRKRKMNQDYVFATESAIGPLPNLLLLADGMGGHKGGGFASQYLVETFQKYLRGAENDTPVRVIENGIRQINREMYDLSRTREELSGMGTTMVLAFISGMTLTVANIGDSRLYVVHGRRIQQITRDHSYVEELARRGLLDRNSDKYIRQKNIITRAVGIDTTVEADYFEVELSEEDCVLLCSDGLTNMVDNESILNVILDRAPIADRGQALIDLANINGGSDNIGVILADSFHEEGRA